MNAITENILREAADAFAFDRTTGEISRYGEGHINDTFVVWASDKCKEQLKSKKSALKVAAKELSKAEAKKVAAEKKAAEEAKKAEAESVLKKLLASGMSADEIVAKLQ